jgi:anti-sigma factor RsiW
MKEKLALYAGGDLPPEEMAVFEEHFAWCTECQAEYEAMRKTLLLVSTFSPPTPSVREFTEGVRERRARESMRLTIRYSLAAAAAIVIFTFLCAGLLFRDTPEQSPTEPVAANVTAVDVEMVDYSEARIYIKPTEDKSMTVVWIVSDEVVEEGN